MTKPNHHQKPAEPVKTPDTKTTLVKESAGKSENFSRGNVNNREFRAKDTVTPPKKGN